MIANVCLACSVRVYICNFSLFRLFSCHDWIIMLWSSKVCEACSEEFCHGACVLFDYSHQVSFDYSHQVDFDHNQVNLINVFLKVCFQTNKQFFVFRKEKSKGKLCPKKRGRRTERNAKDPQSFPRLKLFKNLIRWELQNEDKVVNLTAMMLYKLMSWGQYVCWCCVSYVNHVASSLSKTNCIRKWKWHFSLKIEKIHCPLPHCNFPIVHWSEMTSGDTL